MCPKFEVSILALDRMDLIHLAMVALDAVPCGFVDVKKTVGSFADSEPFNIRVLSMYSCSVRAGKMFLFLGKAGKKFF